MIITVMIEHFLLMYIMILNHLKIILLQGIMTTLKHMIIIIIKFITNIVIMIKDFIII